ncbi:MAG: TetR/AcrR family transcriptional regulator [Ktedonobacteraceae bacterium]|nr:TetR/AcrR family transcriptional regulator [Ktedonobacteraceae bacterium]
MQAPRPLKERQKQEREALILKVAEEVLLEKGYHETSMEEIATRVGVAKGTVYLHFPSKEDLVVAIFSRDLQRFSQAVEEALAVQMTARAKLEALLRFMFCGYFSKRTQLLYRLYHNLDLRKLFEQKGGCMRDIWEGIAERVRHVLEEGKAAGEFDNTLPTGVMLSTFLGLLSIHSYERLIINEHMQPEDVARHLGTIYFKGIAAPPEM